jgi:sulfur dioxygenase
MIFRQMFDSVSGTYSYLLARKRGGEALIIDPVLEKVERYIQLLNELDLRLVRAIDTHLHADHVTGLGELRDRTQCVTVMGKETRADVVSIRVADGDTVEADGVRLGAIYTPGHTDDSYCFTFEDRVFTGDTLLIRGTGRTDFQNGDARAQYDSLFNRLLKLPDATLVLPGARLQRRYRQHHRRGEGVQPAPAGRLRRRLCRHYAQPSTYRTPR